MTYTGFAWNVAESRKMKWNKQNKIDKNSNESHLHKMFLGTKNVNDSIL